MLRVISSKLAGTPGELSVPHTNQEVLQPYKSIYNWGKGELQKRKQEKARRQPNDLSYLERTRNPANGTCPTCGDNMGLYYGKPICPTRECNAKRPRFSL